MLKLSVWSELTAYCSQLLNESGQWFLPISALIIGEESCDIHQVKGSLPVAEAGFNSGL